MTRKERLDKFAIAAALQEIAALLERDGVVRRWFVAHTSLQLPSGGDFTSWRYDPANMPRAAVSTPSFI